MASFFGFFSNRKKEVKPLDIADKKVQPHIVEQEFGMSSVQSFSRPDIPAVVEERNREFILFGKDNRFPDLLIDFMNTSSIHNAILVAKTTMSVGGGLKFGLTDISQETDQQRMIKDLTHQMAFDWYVFGAYAIEIILRKDKTGVAEINNIDVSKIRLQKPNADGVIEHVLYHSGWDKSTRDFQVIPMYDPEKVQEHSIMYVKNSRPGIAYYGSPEYLAGLPWINIDAQLAQYFLSTVENGFSPSVSIKFYKTPGSPEQKDNIVRGIKKEYEGTKNAGKAMIFFSDGKDLAPDVDPIQTQNLDKQYTVLSENVIQNIISAHRVTSPMLLGIATPGKLGYSTELESAYKIFQSTVIGPDQLIFEKTLNDMSKLLGIQEKVTINKLNPLL